MRHDAGIQWKRAATLLVGIVVALDLAGCDSRASAIRAELSPGELRLFDAGRSLSTQCWTCHDFYGEQNKIGPYLSGVFGRPAGSARFGGYSEAMKGSGVVWNEPTLKRFLANVNGFIPGNNMVAQSVRSASDLEALVFYIERVTAPTAGDGAR